MATIQSMIKFFSLIMVFTACNNQQKSLSVADQQSYSETQGQNYLSMKIDGKEWVAERKIFGSYHFSDALGPGLINIAGVKGEDPNDQNFNINLFNTTAEGTYQVNIDDSTPSKPNANVSQLTLLTPTNYLCGGAMLGNQMTVSITKVSKNPQIVQATFNGTMQCAEGNKITITDGKFYYHENNN